MTNSGRAEPRGWRLNNFSAELRLVEWARLKHWWLGMYPDWGYRLYYGEHPEDQYGCRLTAVDVYKILVTIPNSKSYGSKVEFTPPPPEPQLPATDVLLFEMADRKGFRIEVSRIDDEPYFRLEPLPPNYKHSRHHQSLDGNALTQIAAAAALSATAIKMTAEREITATVAVQALTAGKANIMIEYLVSN